MTTSLNRCPRPYTLEEDAIIVRLYPGKGPRACRAELPGRNDSSIVGRARKLGLPGPKGLLSAKKLAGRLQKSTLTRQRRMANPERDERKCLGICGLFFTSEWKGHRMCDSCRKRAARLGIGAVASGGGT